MSVSLVRADEYYQQLRKAGLIAEARERAREQRLMDTRGAVYTPPVVVDTTSSYDTYSSSSSSDSGSVSVSSCDSGSVSVSSCDSGGF